MSTPWPSTPPIQLASSPVRDLPSSVSVVVRSVSTGLNRQARVVATHFGCSQMKGGNWSWIRASTVTVFVIARETATGRLRRRLVSDSRTFFLVCALTSVFSVSSFQSLPYPRVDGRGHRTRRKHRASPKRPPAREPKPLRPHVFEHLR